MSFDLDRAWRTGNWISVGIYLKLLCDGLRHNPPVESKFFISNVIASGRHPNALSAVALFVQYVDPKFDRGVMLADACRGGHLRLIRYLIKHIDPITNDSAAIRLAHYYRRDECVRFLQARSDSKVRLLDTPSYRLSPRPETIRDDRAVGPSFWRNCISIKYLYAN